MNQGLLLRFPSALPAHNLPRHISCKIGSFFEFNLPIVEASRHSFVLVKKPLNLTAARKKRTGLCSLINWDLVTNLCHMISHLARVGDRNLVMVQL